MVRIAIVVRRLYLATRTSDLTERPYLATSTSDLNERLWPFQQSDAPCRWVRRVALCRYHRHGLDKRQGKELKAVMRLCMLEQMISDMRAATPHGDRFFEAGTHGPMWPSCRCRIGPPWASQTTAGSADSSATRRPSSLSAAFDQYRRISA